MHPVALIAVIKGNETSKMLAPPCQTHINLTTAINEGIMVTTNNERASMVEYKNRDKYKPRRTPRKGTCHLANCTGPAFFLSFF